MPKEERKIIELFTTDGIRYTVGEEEVEFISFRKDIHHTVGHSGMPCYIVKHANSTIQLIVPLHSMSWYRTDAVVAIEAADVPELPE